MKRIRLTVSYRGVYNHPSQVVPPLIGRLTLKSTNHQTKQGVYTGLFKGAIQKWPVFEHRPLLPCTLA